MKLKYILLLTVLLVSSGCVNITLVPGRPVLNEKYLANNTDTITFTDKNIFYATEYIESTKQTIEFTGFYNVVGNEVILEYKVMGFIRRFEVSSNARTLTEINNGIKGMQFNLVNV